MSKLNPKTLMIAAIVLMLLALLVMATPLLRTTTGLAGRTRSIRPFNSQGGGVPGQNFPGGQNGSQGQVNPNFPTGPFQGRQRSGILRLGFLNGVMGTIVYAVALLASLAAAVGMFMTKRWGKILGIIMASLYAVMALVSLVPTLLIGLALRAGGNFLSIGLNVAHLVLAIAVIVLASIPVRGIAAPITPAAPPVPSA